MKTIRKYFKNAKIVECLMAGTYEIDLKTIYKDKDHRYWCRCKNTTDHCLLFKDGEFAKIIEVKKPKQETRMFTLQQLKDCWHSSDENMRSQFSSSDYKRITFEQWLEKQ